MKAQDFCSQIVADPELDIQDREATRQYALNLIRRSYPLDSAADQRVLLEETLSNLWGLGSIETFFKDSQISEIMINAGEVWIEKSGRLEKTDLRLADSDVYLLIERILAPLGLRVDRMNPQVDARLLDGSRVHIILPPLAIDGIYINIRRFLPRDFELTDFLFSAAEEVAQLLRWAVDARANILISGGTSTGKTTLINVLAKNLAERIITIEDTAELTLPKAHTLRLETRQANAEGVGKITQRELVKSALRMRPDRIIMGEVRGAEALDMLQAMNTGNEGAMTSCHANSAPDAISRLETMVLTAGSGLNLTAVRAQIFSALDLVVHLQRDKSGDRKIAAIYEVPAQLRDGPGIKTGDELKLLADDRQVFCQPEFPPRNGQAW